MYLWQIRHIPNQPQSLLKLIIATVASGVVVASAFVSTTFVSGQASDTAKDKKETDAKSAAAQEFFERVRQELPKHQSIKADMAQVVSIGDQRFKVDGQYLSAGKKLRLSYTVLPDQGVKGVMLEVCDGKELWTLLDLADSKRVTRRNIQQILAAAAAIKKDSDEETMSVDLGLGGLVALFASLDRTMVFDAIKEEDADGHPRTIIQGRWKKEKAPWPKDKDDAFPAFIPDLVRIYVDSQTLFPERVLYLKKMPGKKAFKPLVSLEFKNVEFDVPVDDKTFGFEVPQNVVPEDVTKQYLERLTAPPAKAEAPTK